MPAGTKDRMSLVTLFRSRFSRGFSLATLGLNEPRLLYDTFCAVFGIAAALAFERLTGGPAPGSLSASGLQPPLFGAGGWALGVYGRFRMSTALTKATLLAMAALMAAIGAESPNVGQTVDWKGFGALDVGAATITGGASSEGPPQQ